MESKEEKFIRLAESRTNELIKKIKLIGNLSNRSNYQYSKTQVNEIFKVLETELKIAKQQFEVELGNENKNFKFKRKGD
ncbi:hypothetical protein [Mammaliicoccus lentus]|uniref:hypothetical protein n=1 Tax=Mammaliicoccus lentus TaxID=42858 RepID=UPI0011C80B08|nr:hypothetical protein [Mammaliicoccus lentus]